MEPVDTLHFSNVGAGSNSLLRIVASGQSLDGSDCGQWDGQIYSSWRRVDKTGGCDERNSCSTKIMAATKPVVVWITQQYSSFQWICAIVSQVRVQVRLFKQQPCPTDSDLSFLHPLCRTVTWSSRCQPNLGATNPIIMLIAIETLVWEKVVKVFLVFRHTCSCRNQCSDHGVRTARPERWE